MRAGAIDHAAERGGGESEDSGERVTRPALGRGPHGFRLEAGDEVRGPVHDALERALAPRMVKGTGHKTAFDLRRTGTPTGAITLAGVVLEVARTADTDPGGWKAGGGRCFQYSIPGESGRNGGAYPLHVGMPGEEFSGGAKATFQVDLTAHPEFPVTVDAVGFTARVVRVRFRKAELAAGGRMSLIGEPVRR